MREFHNPGNIFRGLFGGAPKARAQPVQAPAQAQVAASVTKDGDEPARKPSRTRGVSTQRATLLTIGTAVGQETRRRSLLGVS